MAQSSIVVQNIEKGYEFVAVEREKHNSKEMILPVQLLISQQKKNYLWGSSSQMITQGRILILTNTMTLRQVRLRIFKLFRPIIEQAPDISRSINLKGDNYTEDDILEAEYKYFFESNNFPKDGDGFDNPLYKIQIYNNAPQNMGFFYNSHPECEFRGGVHKDNCDLDVLPDSTKLKDVTSRLRDRDLYLVVHWKNNP